MSSGDLVRAAVLGASGYVGGELLRLLLGHPRVTVATAVSERLAGRRVDGPHPHLRGLTDLVFAAPGDLGPADVLFLAVGHTRAMHLVPGYAGRFGCLIDLSADFRLRDPAAFERYYGTPHAAPELLGTFTPGWPERHRADLVGAARISVPGCMATAAILGLDPLVAAGLVTGPVVVDGRIGSSGAGAAAAPHNTHAERAGAMRVYAPVSHRHEAEIAQATGLAVTMSATAVPAVRGAQVLCRVPVAEPQTVPGLRRLYHDRYADEPFVRVVAQRRGTYRLPEPAILTGSNLCEVGYATSGGPTVVVVAALDNLMKGAAGCAVQCLNIRMGWPERLGLEFAGLHPV